MQFYTIRPGPLVASIVAAAAARITGSTRRRTDGLRRLTVSAVGSNEPDEEDDARGVVDDEPTVTTEVEVGLAVVLPVLVLACPVASVPVAARSSGLKQPGALSAEARKKADERGDMELEGSLTVGRM